MASAFQNFVQPAQQWFGQQKRPYSHTHYEQIDSVQSSPYTPQSTTFYQNSYSLDNKISDGQQRAFRVFNRLQRITGVVFGIADVCSCTLTLLIEIVMVFMLVKFYQTQNIPAPGRTGPWFKDTTLWPTYLLASVALVTFVLSLWEFIKSCRKDRKSNRIRLTLKVIKVVIHVGAWIAVAAFYRIAKTGHDLWGWSCSQKAAEIQPSYSNFLNFEHLCNIQTGSWAISIAEVVIKILFAGIGFYFQFKLVRVKRSIAASSGEAGLETLMALT